MPLAVFVVQRLDVLQSSVNQHSEQVWEFDISSYDVLALLGCLSHKLSQSRLSIRCRVFVYNPTHYSFLSHKVHLCHVKRRVYGPQRPTSHLLPVYLACNRDPNSDLRADVCWFCPAPDICHDALDALLSCRCPCVAAVHSIIVTDISIIPSCSSLSSHMARTCSIFEVATKCGIGRIFTPRVTGRSFRGINVSFPIAPSGRSHAVLETPTDAINVG